MGPKLGIRMGHYEILSALAPMAPHYLEIGVREGGSLRHILNAAEPEKILLCDTWGRESGGSGRGNHDHITELLTEYKFPLERVEFIDGKSQNVPWKKRGEWWDLVNVDGSHLAKDAEADIKNLWPLTRRWMVVHDAKFPAVWEGVIAASASLHGAVATVCFGDQGTLILERV